VFALNSANPTTSNTASPTLPAHSSGASHTLSTNHFPFDFQALPTHLQCTYCWYVFYVICWVTHCVLWLRNMLPSNPLGRIANERIANETNCKWTLCNKQRENQHDFFDYNQTSFMLCLFSDYNQKSSMLSFGFLIIIKKFPCYVFRLLSKKCHASLHVIPSKLRPALKVMTRQ